MQSIVVGLLSQTVFPPKIRILLLLGWLLIGNNSIAQTVEKVEGVAIAPDSTPVHSPKKAALMSAALPGLGQVYNRKYWKVPLDYAMAGGLVYWAITSRSKYLLNRESYRSRVDTAYSGIDHFPTESNASLREEMERTQKNMELAIILTGVVYIAQIVDAAVDAHLRYFDVSDNLSMRIKPSLIPIAQSSGRFGTFTGISIQFSLR
jgi:hypothetical protein